MNRPGRGPALARMEIMSTSVRRFLACVLLAALPWQGVAAAAMVLCGPAAPASAAQGEAPTDPALVADHATHHGHGGGHDAPHAHDGSADAGQGLQADADHHCGACSLCGHALALPCAPVTLHSPPLPQGPVAGAWPRPDSRVAPLPDKPPRA